MFLSSLAPWSELIDFCILVAEASIVDRYWIDRKNNDMKQSAGYEGPGPARHVTTVSYNASIHRQTKRTKSSILWPRTCQHWVYGCGFCRMQELQAPATKF